jgi:hypothetical protein
MRSTIPERARTTAEWQCGSRRVGNPAPSPHCPARSPSQTGHRTRAIGPGPTGSPPRATGSNPVFATQASTNSGPTGTAAGLHLTQSNPRKETHHQGPHHHRRRPDLAARSRFGWGSKSFTSMQLRGLRSAIKQPRVRYQREEHGMRNRTERRETFGAAARPAGLGPCEPRHRAVQRVRLWLFRQRGVPGRHGLRGVPLLPGERCRALQPELTGQVSEHPLPPRARRSAAGSSPTRAPRKGTA